MKRSLILVLFVAVVFVGCGAMDAFVEPVTQEGDPVPMGMATIDKAAEVADTCATWLIAASVILGIPVLGLGGKGIQKGVTAVKHMRAGQIASKQK